MYYSELITKIKKYFDITEFVSEDVLTKYGEEQSWNFIDSKLLENILYVRETLNSPITINNWKWGGIFSQRGLRHNMQDIVKKKTNKGSIYLSGHVLGCAVDFDVKGMTAQEVRNWLILNKNKLPHNFRLERGVNWVHMDTANNSLEIVQIFG